MITEGLLFLFKGLITFFVDLFPTLPMGASLEGIFLFVIKWIPAIGAFIPFDLIYRLVKIQLFWWSALLLYSFFEWAFQKIFGR